MAIKYNIFDNQVVAKGRWPTTRLNALHESIRKWEFIRDNLRSCTDELECGGTKTCALCHIYMNRLSMLPSCFSCPIDAVGHYACEDTPYEDYCNSETAPAKLAAARKEVAFLKKILASETKKAKKRR